MSRHIQPEQSVSLDPMRYQFQARIDLGLVDAPVASASSLDPLRAWCSWACVQFNVRVLNLHTGRICAARDVGEEWE